MPRDAIVIVLTVFADGTGKTFVPAEVAAALAPISPAPVYAPYDTYLGGGIVGGFMETFESVGVAAADLVLEILSGKDPATLPPQTNPGQAYRVDFRAMQRWGLDESRLPAGTLVLHKPAEPLGSASRAHPCGALDLRRADSVPRRLGGAKAPAPRSRAPPRRK